MASMLERTAADEITDALTALGHLERYARDVRAHLDAAMRQTAPEGSLAQAARVAATVTAAADQVQSGIRMARYVTEQHRLD